MDRLGIGYDTLKEINPRLVYTSIRGFGDDVGGRSPYAELPTVDVVAQAMGGIMSVTGEDADHPSRVGPGVGDSVPGLFGAFGTLAAVLEARSSGQGQHVDIAMVDSVMAICEQVSTQYGYSGEVPTPTGNRLPQIVPFGMIQTKDGAAVLAVPPGRAWEGFAKVLDKPEWLEDERLNTELARIKNRDFTYDTVESLTREMTRAELFDLLKGVVPFAPIYDAGDIAKDPHFAVREMLVPVDHPGIDAKLMVSGVPVKLSRTPGGVASRAPLLGEHTDEILAEAGVSANEIAALRGRQVVA
jgi:crotonobetainyl-CoA:carnitine CoA-transferase CaiB-like acyl-CoA transferase